MSRAAEVERFFLEALDRPAPERQAFLDDVCADAEVRAEVGSLLAAHDAAGEFLETADATRAAALLDSEEEPPDARFGPYRLMQEIGRGGMGVVYRAERADGQFEQQVALKVLKRGMDSDEILRRFLVERQILARLQHAHIARLLDGGVGQNGQPYYVMEYVEGRPLSDHCNERRLSIEARLELFVHVCEAVQYAHQQLVVHRDLKPSNILVTAGGEVKLLDFGIAKLLDPAAGVTRTEARLSLATPEYGAPEQMRGEPVTTAADIYALGVVLYELLAGRRPYRFAERTPEQILEVVSTVEPVRPSTAAPARLRRRLRGDLDTIVLKALRKEPERRYGSAEALLEDVRRHLAGLPVRARPDTLAYRTAKFARRHAIALGAVGLVIASLAIGLGIAVRQTRLARREATRAAEVQKLVTEIFEVTDPEEARGESVTARELLDRAAERVDQGLDTQPDMRAEMKHVIGTLFFKLGLYERALTQHEAALEARRELFGSTAAEVAESLEGLGEVCISTGDYERAERAYREALAMRRELEGESSEAVAGVLDSLGLVLAEQGKYAEAEQLQRRALAIHRAAAAGGESREVATALSNLGLTLRWAGDFDAAEPLHREALEMKRRVFGADHPEVGWAMEHLGVWLGQRGDYAAAEPLLVGALEILERVHGESHPEVALVTNNLAKMYLVSGDPRTAEPLFRRALATNIAIYGEENRRVAVNLTNLGEVMAALARYDEAARLHERVLAMRRKLLGDRHWEVAMSLHFLGHAELMLGRLDAAGTHYREALDIGREAWTGGHPFLAQILSGYGELHVARAAYAEAEPLLREALAIREKVLVEGDWQRAETRVLLGECLVGLGRVAEARPLLRDGHRALRQARGAPAYLLARSSAAAAT
jgi:serine/threonine-protein kinase